MTQVADLEGIVGNCSHCGQEVGKDDTYHRIGKLSGIRCEKCILEAEELIEQAAEVLGEELDEAEDCEPETIAVSIPTPDANDLAELQTWKAKVQSAASSVERLREIYETSKNHTAKTKKAWEAEAEYLVELIAREPEPFPLLDNKPKGPALAENGPGGSVVASNGQPADESWRSVELSTLGLTGAITTALAEAAIHNMGDLANYSRSGARLTDIPGIGPKKAEAIEEASADFWAARNAVRNLDGSSDFDIIAVNSEIEDDADDEAEDLDIE